MQIHEFYCFNIFINNIDVVCKLPALNLIIVLVLMVIFYQGRNGSLRYWLVEARPGDLLPATV